MAVTLPDIPTALGRGLAHIHDKLKSILEGLRTALATVDTNADDALAGKIKTPVVNVAADAGGTTVDAGPSGEFITNIGALGALTINLPDASTGLTYRILKDVAGQDVILQAAAGDSVCGSAAGKKYKNVTDAGYLEIVAVDDDTWKSLGTPEGTWAVDDS
ncbi:MAG: hypothetical protein KJ621_01995 [Proteobacteria bacterium]|nr:hypothetical protein [Pseudomonadota bacterium]